jgi:hypothetical protein
MLGESIEEIENTEYIYNLLKNSIEYRIPVTEKQIRYILDKIKG